MTSTAIHVEGLSKEYTIGGRERAGMTFREALLDTFAAPARLLTGRRRTAEDRRFWALKDVGFAIPEGEVVGIVGRNGAGKSTLLKILSRITAPTRGSVRIRGRVASLLEVGTGFHPELTGRENIRLNGAILGMSRGEIARKFDEIVDFSGVETFIDTPVKRYSSGMQVRLAFAVAAHLEPEILLIDEVLAVGDAEFQKKCLGKMGEIAERSGRTVLFVSHQLGMVARLCPRCILLSGGEVSSAGETRDVLDVYKRQMESLSVVRRTSMTPHGPYISSIRTVSESGEGANEFFFDEEITVSSTIVGHISNPATLITTTLVSRSGDYIATNVTSLAEVVDGRSDSLSVDITFPRGVIAPNDYFFRVALFVPASHVIDLHELAAPTKIRDSGSSMSAFEGISYGHVILPCRSCVSRTSR